MESEVNPNSILDSVKKDLGIMPDYTHFDPDIIMGINTAFSVLNQLGVGPDNGFSISDNTSLWTDYLPDDPRLNMVKTYVAKKTKLFFDPPTNGPLSEAFNKVLSELEWRINVAVDPKQEEN
jgi:hypothetical protein